VLLKQRLLLKPRQLRMSRLLLKQKLLRKQKLLLKQKLPLKPMLLKQKLLPTFSNCSHSLPLRPYVSRALDNSRSGARLFCSRAAVLHFCSLCALLFSIMCHICILTRVVS
jgi:hypothetical protein